ncbi:hypothetical protein GQX74_014877 [Glossina fuscipes]|nr:hypothetical protein GQX74_014877 [Glossina fuscipes]
MAVCAEFGLEALSTVEEMRKLLGVLAGSTNPSKDTIERLEKLETKYTPRTTLTIDDTGSRATSPRRAPQELMSSNNAMGRVRNWPVKDDGDTNPLEFIERLEELCETYDIQLTLIPKTMIDLQDVIPFVSDTPNISTTMRMVDGTLRYTHRELVPTVSVGETHFHLPLIVLDDVDDNLTLRMDFLIKAQIILVIGERAIQFGNTLQRPKDSWSGKPFDTITNQAHGITGIAQETPNWEQLHRQTRRSKPLEKECVIAPMWAQKHWRLIIVANPQRRGRFCRLTHWSDTLMEQLATNIRRKITRSAAFCCSKIWSTIEDRARPIANPHVARVLVHDGRSQAHPRSDRNSASGTRGQGRKGPGRSIKSTESSDPIDDIIIPRPEEQPTIVRAMTAIEQPRAAATEGVSTDSQEPITLGMIQQRDAGEELGFIEPTIGLINSGAPLTSLEFGDTDE